MQTNTPPAAASQTNPELQGKCAVRSAQCAVTRAILPVVIFLASLTAITLAGSAAALAGILLAAVILPALFVVAIFAAGRLLVRGISWFLFPRVTAGRIARVTIFALALAGACAASASPLHGVRGAAEFSTLAQLPSVTEAGLGAWLVAAAAVLVIVAQVKSLFFADKLPQPIMTEATRQPASADAFSRHVQKNEAETAAMRAYVDAQTRTLWEGIGELRSELTGTLGELRKEITPMGKDIASLSATAEVRTAQFAEFSHKLDTLIAGKGGHR